jgi:hypothetical protein
MQGFVDRLLSLFPERAVTPRYHLYPIPKIGECIEVITASITPTSVKSLVRIRFNAFGNPDSSGVVVMIALFRDDTANALAARRIELAYNDAPFPLDLEFDHVPATFNKVTYRIGVGKARGIGVISHAMLVVEEFDPKGQFIGRAYTTTTDGEMPLASFRPDATHSVRQ